MIKAYYVIRRDLKLSPAKMAVQVGHGTQYLTCIAIRKGFLKDWVELGASRKIVCEVKNDTELNKLRAIFNEHKQSYQDIIDFGYTEVDPYTATGIAFFIDDENCNEVILKKVKRLQTYKNITFVQDAVEKDHD